MSIICSGCYITLSLSLYHFINFIGLSLTNLQTKNEYRLTRNFSKVKIDIFNNELRNLRWNNVLTCNDVDSSFDIFWNDFIALFELHFPLKKVKFNKNIHKKKKLYDIGITCITFNQK